MVILFYSEFFFSSQEALVLLQFARTLSGKMFREAANYQIKKEIIKKVLGNI